MCNSCHQQADFCSVSLSMLLKGRYETSGLLLQRGIEVNTQEYWYRYTYQLLGLFRFYSAKIKLPKLHYILLFRTLYAKCEPCTLEDFDDSSTIQLSLVYNKNRRLIVHETRTKKEIMEYARFLASDLKLRIRDSATDRRNPVWLN
jgi:hypothetical protein